MLTIEEIKKAQEFALKRTNELIKRAGQARSSVQPLGSDVLHPELWKAIHWKWFIERYSIYRNDQNP